MLCDTITSEHRNVMNLYCNFGLCPHMLSKQRLRASPLLEICLEVCHVVPLTRWTAFCSESKVVLLLADLARSEHADRYLTRPVTCSASGLEFPYYSTGLCGWRMYASQLEGQRPGRSEREARVDKDQKRVDKEQKMLIDMQRQRTIAQ